MKKVFYSWQSDITTSVNRNLIENAISKAIKNINNNIQSNDEKYEMDRDTVNVPGSPDIVETIITKINSCSIFIGDVTPVGVSSNGKKMPNSNVFFESGYAVGKLSFNRVILILNDSFGSVEDLPFDVKTKRILTYTLSEEDACNPEVKSNVLKSITARIAKTLELERELAPVTFKECELVNEEIKRQRDLTKLQRFMENLPAKVIQNHIILGRESLMMDFDTLIALYNIQAVQQFSSFRFYDNKLKDLINDFVTSFDKSLSFGFNFHHYSDTKYRFRASQDCGESEYLSTLTALELSLEKLLDYVHQEYIEVDVEQSIITAWNKYRSEIKEL